MKSFTPILLAFYAIATNANAKDGYYVGLEYQSGSNKIHEIRAANATFGYQIFENFAIESAAGLGLAGPKNAPNNDYYDNGINTLGLDAIVYLPLKNDFKLGASVGYFFSNPVIYKHHHPHNKDYFDQYFISSSTWGVRAQVPLASGIMLIGQYKEFNKYDDFKALSLGLHIPY